MKFEWDPRKAAANLVKHRVAFEEAATAIRDDFAAVARDPDHSLNEYRFITFGISSAGRLLMVSHTERAARYPSGRYSRKSSARPLAVG